MDRYTLQGKTALITGAAKRIGREVAFALADAGCHVAIHYNTSPAEAETLRAEIGLLGVNAWTVQADFAQPEQYETLIERAERLAGPIETLINNASIFPYEPLASMTRDTFMRTMEVNAWVPFALSRAFAARAKRGKIINLLDASLAGIDRTHAAYQLSKHTLAMLTRMMALEFAPHVLVNAVAPGYILPLPGQEKYLEKMGGTLPLQRTGEAQEIAAAILDLIRSDYITGEVLYVDGGWHLQERACGPNPY